MDIWIFIAAAGSGYLAQFWQNSQNLKRASQDVTNDDDDDQSGSLSQTTPKRRSAKRRFHQKLCVPKLREGGGTIRGGRLTTSLHCPLLDDSESWGVLDLCNGAREDACSCSSTPTDSERGLPATYCYCTSASSSLSRCLEKSSFDAVWPQKCRDFVLVRNRASSNFAGTFSDDCGCYMSNLYSKDHLDPHEINKFCDCCSLRYGKDKHKTTTANGVQGISSHIQWRTSYHDQCEDVCAVGLSDAHMMQQCKAKTSGEVSPCGYENERGSNLLRILLFNFGLGVGMMFAIMSNKHGTQQIIGDLEEAMTALKDLQAEIQIRKKCRHGFDNNKENKENISLEKSPSVLQKVFGLLEQVRASLVKHSGSFSTMDYDCSQERARLEAELQAELERIEFDFNVNDTSANEDGLGIDDMLSCEMPSRPCPCDIDAHATEYGNSLSHESCAVRPVELAKRLYEVLETRQEEKIMELEAEIERLGHGLQAKEQQLQAWKQRVHHLLQATTCINLSSLQTDLHVETEDRSIKDVYSSISNEELFVVGMEHPLPFCNNEDMLSNPVDNGHPMHPSISQEQTCSGDEACEGWIQPLNNTCSGSPSHLHKGLVKDADKRDRRSRSITMAQAEVMDVFYDSGSSSSSNNAVIDIWGSASCSKISMDRETRINQLKNDVEVETSNKQEVLSIERSGNVTPCPDTNCLCQDACAQDVIDINDMYGQCGRTLQWSTSEDSCYSSDLDDQLGQSLIELIVQKGRKGVLMVEAAKSVMASFDVDNTGLEIGIPSTC